MSWDRRFCLNCGAKLNSREWFYGACSECIKLRGKLSKWDKIGKHLSEKGWFYADNAPRYKEYADPHEMDDEGVVQLCEAIFGNIKHYHVQGPDEPEPERKRKPAPEGMKRCSGCGKLIPADGPNTCPVCLLRHKRHYAELRARRINNHECYKCGVKLPVKWNSTICEACLAREREYKAIRKQRLREGTRA